MLPYKSSKSMHFLKLTIKSHTCCSTEMFMLPIPTMSTMKYYVKLLFSKYVKPHFQEVHVVFDNPSALPESPKEIEHRRRDKGDVTRVIKVISHVSRSKEHVKSLAIGGQL